jgi:lipoprotein-anchoring transpeptidase ErfK/SrfK
MRRVGEHRASGANRKLWRIAVLTAAGAIGAASNAEAALYYWSDQYPGYYQPGPMVPQRRLKPRNRQVKKTLAPEKDQAKPQGPLIIAISIERQNVRIYDANGFFAEAPVSTGMKGHPTPMGVFSVIQKHKFHHSNIYSGAPMPFMQRITWSGVAMHAGVLPGYPASHGCIRMPMAFAMKMWNWTKMGARVVITPGEITPASFSHPLLAAQRVVPQPAAANEPQTDAPPAAKADKAADAGVTTKPAISEARLELRSTVGHDDGVKPEPLPSTPLTRTADAGALPATKAPVTMTDAAPSGGNASPREETAARTDRAPDIAEDAKVDANSETAKSEAEPAAAKPDEIAASDENPVETKPAEDAIPEIKSAENDASDKGGEKPDQAAVAAPTVVDAAKLEDAATGSMKTEAKPDDVKAESSKPDAAAPSTKPGETIKAATDVGAGAPAKKDQTRLPDIEKAAASQPDPATAAAPKRSGQIAVFISRKDAKLYVRQNFAPLFEVPVTIAPSDRPPGTHVFTAQVDKVDANILHWSVVSLPAPARYVERRDEDERTSRRRKIAGAVEMKVSPVPDSPAEALDRLTIPGDAMARITEALSTGGSIIVSDQGINAGETGEGTDFIVSLR